MSSCKTVGSDQADVSLDGVDNSIVNQLQISRPSRWFDRVRKYKIYCNDIEICVIKNGETRLVDIPDGGGVIHGGIDWTQSNRISYHDLDYSDKLIIKNSFSHTFIFAPILAYWYITFGYRNYLKIEIDKGDDVSI